MDEHHSYWELTDETADADHPGINWLRRCLVGSIFFFLGLAGLINRWLPEEYVAPWVLLYFSVEIAFLLAHGIDGYDEDEIY
jgi:hypothetical protein